MVPVCVLVYCKSRHRGIIFQGRLHTCTFHFWVHNTQGEPGENFFKFDTNFHFVSRMTTITNFDFRQMPKSNWRGDDFSDLKALKCQIHCNIIMFSLLFNTITLGNWPYLVKNWNADFPCSCTPSPRIGDWHCLPPRSHSSLMHSLKVPATGGPLSLGSRTQLLDRDWSLYFSGVTQGLRCWVVVGILTNSMLSTSVLEFFPGH